MPDELKRKKKVIIVTDGDQIARAAVEEAARNIGGRCISASAGNPTPLTGSQTVEFIKQTPYDPVVVMVDDKGSGRKGKGETVMEYVAKHPDMEVIGVVAVASNTENIDGIQVNCAVTKEKKLLQCEVDKYGNAVSAEPIIMGDTVDVLNELASEIPFVVGIGDIGKMDGKDNPLRGAQVTTMALQTVLDNWEKQNYKEKENERK